MIDIEQSDEKNNFNIEWSTIKDILVQQRLLKVIQWKKLENMMDEDWEELKARVLSIIHLSLAIK